MINISYPHCTIHHLILKPRRTVQHLHIGVPDVLEGVRIAVGGEVGYHEDVVARDVALVHPELEVGVAVLVLAPAQAYVPPVLLLEQGSCPDFMVAPVVAPSEREHVSAELDIVGKPLGQAFRSAHQRPYYISRFRLQFTLNTDFISFHSSS